MHAHLAFVTKYRHPVSTDAHLTRMEEIMREVFGVGDFETELE
ncbi:transposase [Saccharopolyspora pogona]|nr:transposase [Saccharopolyspora pogona]